MKYTIQRVTETENGESVQEIVCLEREMPEIPGIESVGITLAEAKALLLGIQQALVGLQVSECTGLSPTLCFFPNQAAAGIGGAGLPLRRSAITWARYGQGDCFRLRHVSITLASRA